MCFSCVRGLKSLAQIFLLSFMYVTYWCCWQCAGVMEMAVFEKWHYLISLPCYFAQALKIYQKRGAFFFFFLLCYLRLLLICYTFVLGHFAVLFLGDTSHCAVPCCPVPGNRSYIWRDLPMDFLLPWRLFCGTCWCIFLDNGGKNLIRYD